MPIRKAVADQVKRWIREIRAAAAEEPSAPAAAAPDPAVAERLDKLEKKLSMTMGAVQAATAEITRLKAEVEEAKRRADQAVARAESALATAESAAES
jgi:hypothetical protein